jgi:16S rRNA (guanine527-N7)-methyltransferase
MTEDEARRWLSEVANVSRETLDQLDAFVAFLKEESSQQNLISAASLENIWTRHIVDSAQLLRFAPDVTTKQAGTWLDLGSGAGFPGLIIAMLGQYHVTLVESRAKRIDYLQRAIAQFALGDCVSVAGMPLERLETASYSVISARAFAPLPRLLDLSARFSNAKTLWLLPKGRNAVKELHEAHSRWNLDFAVEDSVTDSDAGILVGKLRGERSLVPMKGQQKR